MKKNLLVAALLAVSFGLSAQSAVPQSRTLKSSKISSAVDQQVKPMSVQLLENEKTEVKEVLQTINGKDGSRFQMVKLGNGVVKKQILRPDNQIRIESARVQSKRAYAAALRAEVGFSEGFEGYDEEVWGWIPEGWSKESKTGSPEKAGPIGEDEDEGYYVNYMWKTSIQGFFGPAPTEGNCYGFVQFSSPYILQGEEEPTIPPTQDEWLISSKVKVNKGEFFNFDVQYDPGFARLNNETLEEEGEFVFDAMNTIIEFHVSTDNGKTWTKIWDTVEDALSYTEDELWGVIMDGPWLPVSLSASKYEGKEILLAFRYINDGGESTYLDNIYLGEERLPEPYAFYTKPTGMFIWGLSEDYGSFPDRVLYGPAYTPIQWNSHLNNDTESVDWDFYSFELEDYVTVNEENPITEQTWSIGPSPYLNAYNGDLVTSFKWGEDVAENYEGFAAFGGPSSFEFTNDGLVVFAAGNYDLGKGMARTGTTYFSKDYLESETSNNKFAGIANYFDKPLSKYMFETFYVHLNDIEVEDDAELTLTLIRIDATGALKDTINSSTIYGRDILRPLADLGDDYSSIATLKFTFKDIDPETGREQDSYIEIEDALLASLTGFTDGLINPYIQYDDHEFAKCNAYVIWKNEDETRLSTVSSIFGWYTSFMFGMDITMPFLVAEENQYEAPEAGGSNTFVITDYYWIPESEDGEAQWWIDELPEWITVGEMSIDEATNAVSIPVTVAALPAGVKGRSADVVLKSYGCELALQIKQGDAFYVGIPQVKVSEVKAFVKDNNIYVAYPEGTTAVSIYSATGQVVGTYRLDASGASVIPADKLSRGVYFLKFNGKTNETVKVIK